MEMLEEVTQERLPPWGGSGLKYVVNNKISNANPSPSLGREWIEISTNTSNSILNLVSLLGEGVD